MMDFPGKFLRITFPTTFLANDSFKKPGTGGSMQADVNLNKPVEIGLNAPDICPYCDSTEVHDQLKIFNYAGSRSPAKFIAIGVCKEHAKFRVLNPIKFCSILIILVSAGVLSIFINMFAWPIFMVTAMTYFLFNLIHEQLKQDRQSKMFRFEFFPTRSVIHTTSKEWAASFNRLNEGTTVLENVDPFTPKLIHFNKWIPHSCVLFVGSFALSLISISIFNNEILRWLFEVMAIAAILVFMGFLMHSVLLKIPKARYDFYFSSQNAESPGGISRNSNLSAEIPLKLDHSCFICKKGISEDQFTNYFNRCADCYLAFKRRQCRQCLINGIVLLVMAAFLYFMYKNAGITFEMLPVLCIISLGASVLLFSMGARWYFKDPTSTKWARKLQRL